MGSVSFIIALKACSSCDCPLFKLSRTKSEKCLQTNEDDFHKHEIRFGSGVRSIYTRPSEKKTIASRAKEEQPSGERRQLNFFLSFPFTRLEDEHVQVITNARVLFL